MPWHDILLSMEDAIHRSLSLSLLKRKPGEHEKLEEDIAHILSFVQSIQTVVIDEPVSFSKKKNIMRDDVVTTPPGTYQDQFLNQAPKRFKDWFLSKKILP